MTDNRIYGAQLPDEGWKRYSADFDNMSNEEIEAETRHAQDLVDEHEDWLEAVASWEAAGRPRTTKEG
jgi:hypothetical protein